MKINAEFLEKWKACEDGKAWVEEQDTDDAITLINRLIGHNIAWANWLVTRCLKRVNQLSYAIYASESVIGIFEEKYPNDNRPRLAIAAAKKVLESDNEINRKAAARAASEAASAAPGSAKEPSERSAVSAACAASASGVVCEGTCAVRVARAASAASEASEASEASAYPAASFSSIIRHGLGLLKNQEGRK